MANDLIIEAIVEGAPHHLTRSALLAQAALNRIDGQPEDQSA